MFKISNILKKDNFIIILKKRYQQLTIKYYNLISWLCRALRLELLCRFIERRLSLFSQPQLYCAGWFNLTHLLIPFWSPSHMDFKNATRLFVT